MTDLSVLDMLRQLPYFAALPETSLHQLAAQAIPRTFAPYDMLFWEGEPSAGLWLLAKGRVKVYKLSPDGQEYILRFFAPGDTFNELAALDGAANAAHAAALTEVVAWVIPTAVFTHALQNEATIAPAVVQGLVGRIRHLVSQVEDLALRPVTARLARFLLEQVENPALAHPAVTRALIANHLATTPESISRALRSLETAGAIRFDRHQIIIAQLETLQKLAIIA